MTGSSHGQTIIDRQKHSMGNKMPDRNTTVTLSHDCDSESFTFLFCSMFCKHPIIQVSPSRSKGLDFVLRYFVLDQRPVPK